MPSNQTLVSIGLPVYNGEKGLARSLDSLLAQEYPHLEIIVSDNGSTDATRAICQEYASKDARVKYHRSDVNRGAVWNFNQVFALSTGKYFMWAAHDDVRAPTFVSECVARLESSPNAVLCQAHTATFIEGRSEQLCSVDLDSFEGVSGAVERYREVLDSFPATAIYGLYRSSALRKTRMLRQSVSSDLALIQELCIYGDLVQVPKVLFTYYGREKWNTVDQDYRAFFGKEKKPWWYLPFLVLFLDHTTRLARADVPPRVKVRLWSELVTHQAARLSVKALVKTTGKVCPERLKDWLGGKMYWRWMHSPNVKVSDRSLFKMRVIRPSLGWKFRDEPE